MLLCIISYAQRVIKSEDGDCLRQKLTGNSYDQLNFKNKLVLNDY